MNLLVKKWEVAENRHGLIEKHQKLIEKLIEKAARQGDKLTENRISILRLVMDDPYISKADLSKLVGISVAAISANIEVLRGKYLRRVGPDKGGFWECIRGRENSLLESQHKVNSSSNSR